jgi:hypothetical protein
MIRLKKSIPLRFPRKVNVPCSILFLMARVIKPQILLSKLRRQVLEWCLISCIIQWILCSLIKHLQRTQLT